ncbi:hypothetical protein [Caldicellulosiruptor changbaiensis]|uniref:hypothetical protein n=1 Tax=Caldicellulosiruptor changbaiensis TaxID=1222016 RepID=UPI0019D08132|nr:hypothetical protein [Caldicellulosiruptor changbaiensis]
MKIPRRILINIAICILPLANEIVYMQIGWYTREYKKENIKTCIYIIIEVQFYLTKE